MIEFNQRIPMEHSICDKICKDKLKLCFSNRWSYYNCETLKKGYTEMSEINLDLAEIGFEYDVLELLFYELSLKGREKL